MRHLIPTVGILFVLGTTGAVFAQGRGNGHAGGQPQGQGHGKVDAPKVPKTQPPSTTPPTTTTTTTTQTPATKTHGNPHNTPTTPTTVTTVTATTPTSVFVKNPALEARLAKLLPVGMNINDASKGFKNWGQFVAAVHVSQNLNIPFADLKTKMTGPTPMSLGQAIQTFPKSTTTTTTTTTTSSTAVKTAEREANDDFREARENSNRARNDR